jgi:hypothetical protein
VCHCFLVTAKDGDLLRATKKGWASPTRAEKRCHQWCRGAGKSAVHAASHWYHLTSPGTETPTRMADTSKEIVGPNALTRCELRTLLVVCQRVASPSIAQLMKYARRDLNPQPSVPKYKADFLVHYPKTSANSLFSSLFFASAASACTLYKRAETGVVGCTYTRLFSVH